MKCSLCGYDFDEKNGKKSCNGCPLSATCKKIKCPNCGFEMPAETNPFENLKKWGEKLNEWFSKTSKNNNVQKR